MYPARQVAWPIFLLKNIANPAALAYAKLAFPLNSAARMWWMRCATRPARAPRPSTACNGSRTASVDRPPHEKSARAAALVNVREGGTLQRTRSVKSNNGAAGGDRTHDPWLRRPILYPLSYSRMVCKTACDYRLLQGLLAQHVCGALREPQTGKVGVHHGLPGGDQIEGRRVEQPVLQQPTDDGV